MSAMLRRRSLLATVLMGGVLSACGGSDDPDETTGKAKTTVMVYLVASSLTLPAKLDLENMLKARYGKDVNVVLQIGGGDAPESFPGVNMMELARFQLAAGKLGGDPWSLARMSSEHQPAQVAMNKPETLRDFIQWSAKNFPADQYVLSLWDHGGGPNGGFGSDEALGGGETMSVNEITSAIKDAGVHFELIGFDSCLMASLEVASMLSPYANYLVGSEEVTTGWEWTDVLNHVVDHPNTSGADLGKAIVESYKEFDRTNQDGELGFTAYSVTDLKKIAPVVSALDKAANTLRDAIRTQGLDAWWVIAQARRETVDFQTNIFSTSYDLVDVQSWFHELRRANLLSSALVADFDKAYADALVLVDGGEDEASGLMMYFPRLSTLNTGLQAQYASLGFSSSYRGLISDFVQFARGTQMPRVSIADPQVVAGVVNADVTISYGALKSAKATPWRYFDTGYAVLVNGEVAYSMQHIGGSNNQLRMEQANLWPTVNGQLVSLLPEDGEDGDTFLIPAKSVEDGEGMLYAIKGSDGKLRIKYFVGAQTVSGTMSSMLEVDEGEVFYPIQMNFVTQELQLGDKPLIAPAGDWVVEKTSVTGAGYSLYVGASDLTGQLQWAGKGIALPLAA
ncbi:hypothetical protein SDC9_79216 [bioreactor metagenome]|uniref:Clostripain n=1 Tax=bioreactor metagenome TaxID=1076179 RepID=A0A644YXT3_9ZZZZ